MRIAIVASDYAPTVGGVQTAVRNIARHSARRGHCVTILSAQAPGGAPPTELVEGIIIHRFRWGRRPILTLPWRALWTLIGMARVLTVFKPDVVYIHFLSINALYVLLLHYILRFKLIASARGNDIQGIPNRSRAQRWMLRRLFQRADAVLFCSSYVQRDAAPFLAGVSPHTFVGVVGDGFNPEEFQPAPVRPKPPPPFSLSLRSRDLRPKGKGSGVWSEEGSGVGSAPYLLAAGRLVHKKGFDLLIEAFARIADEFPALQLLIAGDGEERRSLQELIDKLGLRDRVTLPGFADRSETIRLFLDCEFFVLSSRIEPFGIVVVEAMAAGKPVLATRSGGVVDLVQPGVNGRLVEPSVDALAEGLREMLSHPEETRRMAEQAPESIQKHTWAAVTDEFLQVFAAVTGEDK